MTAGHPNISGIVRDSGSQCLSKVVRSQGPEATAERLSAIDYFGTGHTNGAPSGSKIQEEEDEEEEDVGEENVSESEGVDAKRRKRKPKAVENDVKATKKKKRKNGGDEEGGC